MTSQQWAPNSSVVTLLRYHLGPYGGRPYGATTIQLPQDGEPYAPGSLQRCRAEGTHGHVPDTCEHNMYAAGALLLECCLEKFSYMGNEMYVTDMCVVVPFVTGFFEYLCQLCNILLITRDYHLLGHGTSPKILLPSAVHLEERLTVSQSVLEPASRQSDRYTQFGFFVSGRCGPKQQGGHTPQSR